MWGDFFSLIYCHYCHSKYNCLIIIDLSVAIRAFSIVTYCHLLSPIATLGLKTGNSQRKTQNFQRKTRDYWRKSTRLSEEKYKKGEEISKKR